MTLDIYSLSAEQIIEINRQILSKSPIDNERNLGGYVRDMDMLEFLSYELEYIPEPLDKAATALQKIAVRHPFIQGNKRTAVVVAFLLLDLAGYKIIISGEKLNHDVRHIIIEECTISQVRTWLKQHMKKV